jgi:peroxin-2
MSSADFATAQARLAARRQAREAETQRRHAEQSAARAAATSRIPFPFRGISGAGLSVWDTIKGREGTQPAFRVGQVDAELLDEELLELLKGQVGEALKYFGSHLQTDYSAEILFALRSVLFKLTIWDHNASYGASLQGLRYSDARDKSLARPPPKKWQKGVYGLITVLGRYGWAKWESYLLDAESGYDEPSPLVKRLSDLTSTLSAVHSVTALASFLTFLYNGRYRTLLDRALRLRLVPSSSHTTREVSFEYLNRQLVWHAFTEFLLFLLPLVGISRWRRILNRAWRRTWLYLKKTFGGVGAEDEDDDIKRGELGFLPERTCAICYADQNPVAGAGSEAEVLAATQGGGVVGSAQTDITNPYEAIPCCCIYCFVCLTQRIEAEEGEGWTCLRCGEIVKECRPWNGDVIEEQPRPGSNGAKSVGFSEDMEMSRSFEDRRNGTRGPNGHRENGGPEIREVEPMPTEDESEPSMTEENLLVPRAIDTNGLTDSAEWSRAASEIVDSMTPPETITDEDEDDQSEEYEEEPEEIADDYEDE